jgi:hypothetical protein
MRFKDNGSAGANGEAGSANKAAGFRILLPSLQSRVWFSQLLQGRTSLAAPNSNAASLSQVA